MSVFGGLLRSGWFKLLAATPGSTKAGLIGLGAALGAHGFYAYSTHDTEMLTVKSSYQLVDHGTSLLMIQDTRDRLYKVSNSVWYGVWDSPERHQKMKPGHKFYVTSYGRRWPIFGTFPNIIRASPSSYPGDTDADEPTLRNYWPPIFIHTRNI